MADPIEIINAAELIAYPGAGAPSQDAADIWVGLVNGLVTEAWANPVTPVPFKVKAIALEAAGRAARNPKALASWTRTTDQTSRTERVSDKVLARIGVYLTPEERSELGGVKRRKKRYGTVRATLGY